MAKKKEILAGFEALGKQSKAVKLVGPSVLTLAEGLQGLNALNGKMGEWAQANPELMKDVPPAAFQSFMAQAALIDEARGVLERTARTMKTMHDAAAGSTASKS